MRSNFIISFALLLGISSITAQPPEEWSQRYTFPEVYHISSLAFIDSIHGWAAGWKHISELSPSGVILHTDDGGITWKDQLIDSTYSWFNDMTFLDGGHGWAAGLHILYMTDDSGKHWTKVPDSLFHCDEFEGLTDLQSISFHDTLRGIIAGTENTLTATSNGGLSWDCTVLITQEGFIDTLNYVQMINGDMACAVGLGGIAMTYDGANTWHVTHTELRNYRKCVFIDDSTGWVLSKESQILRTYDAGWTWEDLGLIYVDYYIAAVDVAFADALTGWVITRAGSMWKTEDGGLTWQEYVINPGMELNSITILPSRHGFLVDNTGNFFARVINETIGIEGQSDVVPQSVHLFPNYPNPFNPTTTIEFSIPQSGTVTLTVYNVLGKEVETVLNEYRNAGHHTLHWNASDVPSGIYFVRMKSSDFSQVRKVTVLR